MFFFKRWSRKSYALFHTLKKEVRISRLSIDLLQAQPIAVAQLSFAQTTNTDSHETDHEHTPPPDILELLGIELLLDFKVAQSACASASQLKSPSLLLLFQSALYYYFLPLLLFPFQIIFFLNLSKHPYSKGSLNRFAFGEASDPDRQNFKIS
ncbi:hypothetical protein [Sediminitomix flava]|uniref:Uncharacterized protein n=1 Tax=Sediminitomix flava TaxID=379075 RepID=A0A315ZFI2_SEDFL|nr:hypothetical protein [Sediminitomix flava]PWJ44325.1 hypothetical protein BC781_101675 [Sediminitomix flava]